MRTTGAPPAVEPARGRASLLAPAGDAPLAVVAVGAADADADDDDDGNDDADADDTDDADTGGSAGRAPTVAAIATLATGATAALARGLLAGKRGGLSDVLSDVLATAPGDSRRDGSAVSAAIPTGAATAPLGDDGHDVGDTLTPGDNDATDVGVGRDGDGDDSHDRSALPSRSASAAPLPADTSLCRFLRLPRRRPADFCEPSDVLEALETVRPRTLASVASAPSPHPPCTAGADAGAAPSLSATTCTASRNAGLGSTDGCTTSRPCSSYVALSNVYTPQR
jgi:hypothetical protein